MNGHRPQPRKLRPTRGKPNECTPSVQGQRRITRERKDKDFQTGNRAILLAPRLSTNRMSREVLHEPPIWGWRSLRQGMMPPLIPSFAT